MAKSKRSCYLCSTQYEYCDCNRQPAFMATFCSENCRDIFKTLCSYGTGAISEEDCKELLDCCDLSNKESYKESTRNTIDKLYAAPVATIEEPEVVIEVVDELIIEEPTEDIIEHDIDAVPEFECNQHFNEVVLQDV